MRVMAVLVRKEWEDAFRNRLVALTLVLLPTLLVVVALVTLASTRSLAGASKTSDAEELKQFAGPICDGLEVGACVTLHLAQVMQMLFLTAATAIPAVIAAYGVVGEKNERTLEPLLATPITTAQLLSAKALAAIVPSVGVTWTALLAFYLGLGAMLPLAHVGRLLDWTWLFALLTLVPLLASLSALVALGVSSRSTDPRSAQQITGVVSLPLVVLISAQAFGVMIIQPATILPAVGALFVLDAVIAAWVLALFERENILTRWTGL